MNIQLLYRIKILKKVHLTEKAIYGRTGFSRLIAILYYTGPVVLKIQSSVKLLKRLLALLKGRKLYALFHPHNPPGCFNIQGLASLEQRAGGMFRSQLVASAIVRYQLFLS